MDEIIKIMYICGVITSVCDLRLASIYHQHPPAKSIVSSMSCLFNPRHFDKETIKVLINTSTTPTSKRVLAEQE
jgi:Ni,Fe-hydrogenase III small subunit